MGDSFGTDINENDVIRILVATDIHLGYEEKDPIKGHDTFDTLEEILQIAEAEEVDFILLGGDLFHHAKPSPYCIYKCTELLRRYCLGDKPVEIEFLTDPNKSFSTSMINYEDPNLNVSIPVFSIHGNHDDPTGQKQISAVDLLATSGLINYFGKTRSYDEIEIQPICFRKGETSLALYGLSYVKDERLGRLFLDDKVTFKYPGNKDDWFHLLVWHQNRAARGSKNYIPEDSLPDFLNLVIWGHEHDCRIVPEQKNKVYVSQPGSSVATSLIEGESRTKHVGLLRVYKKHFKMFPIELKSVRPFVCREKLLDSLEDMAGTQNTSLSASELAMEVVKSEIEDMIAEAKRLGRNPNVAEKPLIRLNVRCRDEKQIFNTIRFGQTYLEKVANPEDMVKCHVIKDRTRRNNDKIEIDAEAVVSANRVEDIVSSTFAENDTLKLFPVRAINEAVKKYIDTNDTDAINDVLVHYKKLILKKLEDDMPELEEIDEAVAKYKIEKEQESLEHVVRLLNDSTRQKKVATAQAPKPKSRKRTGSSDDSDVVRISDDGDDVNDTYNDNSRPTQQLNATASKPLWGLQQQPPAKGPGSRGGKGSRGGRGSRARGKAK